MLVYICNALIVLTFNVLKHCWKQYKCTRALLKVVLLSTNITEAVQMYTSVRKRSTNKICTRALLKAVQMYTGITESSTNVHEHCWKQYKMYTNIIESSTNVHKHYWKQYKCTQTSLKVVQMYTSITESSTNLHKHYWNQQKNYKYCFLIAWLSVNFIIMCD